MTDNEIELIRMIRTNKDPEQALLTATSIILDYLKQHESCQAPTVASPQESA